MKKQILLSCALSSVIAVSGCISAEEAQNIKNDSSIPMATLGTVWNDIVGDTVLKTFLTGDLNSTEIIAGLKEALSVATDDTVWQLGQKGGFSLDPQIKIALPEKYQVVENALTRIGLGDLTDDLTAKMNRAAEVATPRAQALFLGAIKNMTFDDARKILNGADNAATLYLRENMGTQLQAEMMPIVDTAMKDAGVVQAYNTVMGQYDALPFMPDLTNTLNEYITDKAMDGIFYYIAQEEAAIRNDPLKRTSEILKRVFGHDE